MPIFEYVCPDCAEEFETLVFSSTKEIKCPKCGSTNPQKKISTFAFKSGFKFVGTGKKAGSSCSGCSSTNCSSCGG